jgi:hypothetical protein
MGVRRYRLSAICQPRGSWRLTLLETFQIVRENGGEGQNRTVDTTIFRPDLASFQRFLVRFIPSQIV